MTTEERERALAWVNRHWTNKACPFHGPTHWRVDETLAEVRTFGRGALIVGGGVYPLVVVTCSICGYAVFVNALVAGVLQPEPEGHASVEEGANESGAS
jgi:hypothetical protein